jgi:hypothetical protein
LLAVLEMAKFRLLRILQSEEGIIYLQPRFSERQQALERIGALEDESYAG